MAPNPGCWMTRTRRFDLAALALIVAIVGGLGFVLWPHGTKAATGTPSTIIVDRPQPAAPPTQPSVLFIGDSYTAGNGLPELSYGCMAAVRMGWLCHVSAVPGTGYISGGPANRSVVDEYIGLSTSFIERIPGLAAKNQPNVVVLDGGRNDLFPPRQDVFNAMVATIAEARRAWPKATIVFVRPRFLADPGDNLGFDTDFIQSLGKESSDQNIVIVDPISWFSGSDTSDMLRDDGIHPNQRGEQALASALVMSFMSHGIAAAT